MNRRRLVIHPFLFGLFPAVSMLSSNIGEALPRELVLPATAVLATASAGWLVLWPVLPDPHRRGLVLSLLWIPFYAFGPAVNTLRSALGFENLLSPLALAGVLLAAALVCAYPFYRLRRSSWHFARVTGPLNTLALCAILVACATTGHRIFQQHRYSAAQQAQRISEHAGAETEEEGPDIFYIILDAYARQDYLEQCFSHDNGPFLDALRDRGFFVADQSRANYMFTQMSLASSLNFSHHDETLRRLVGEDWDAAVPMLAQAVWENRAVDFLKSRGYEFVTFASGVCVSEIRSADRYIKPPEHFLSDFQRVFFERTPLRLAINRMAKPRWHHRVLFVLDELAALERGEKPLFALAHIMAPHLPHSFDAEGKTLTSPPPYIKGYRDEVIYLNKRILELVDGILEKRPNTVFIIQADHGPWSNWRNPEDLDVPPWEGTLEDYIKDRAAILNAYYFPGQLYDGLYPAITPVNSFRVVFNTFFDAELAMEEDTAYLYTDDRTPLTVEEMF